jgi:hypothetical protein
VRLAGLPDESGVPIGIAARLGGGVSLTPALGRYPQLRIPGQTRRFHGDCARETHSTKELPLMKPDAVKQLDEAVAVMLADLNSANILRSDWR